MKTLCFISRVLLFHFPKPQLGNIVKPSKSLRHAETFFTAIITTTTLIVEITKQPNIAYFACMACAFSTAR